MKPSCGQHPEPAGALRLTSAFLSFFFFFDSSDRYGPARARKRVICKQIYLLVFNILQLFTLIYSGGGETPAFNK